MTKVDSLREILLRKTRDDDTLHTLIKFMDREILAEYAIESLRKMAERSVKGSKLNTAAQDFAKDLTPGHAAMLHDALSHHATKMRAALKANNRDAAAQHAKSFVNTMNSAQRLAAHSDGKLKIDAVDFKPWDQNNFPEHRRGDGKKRTDYTQAKGWHSLKSNDGHALLDSMLRGPHWSYEHSDPRTYRAHKDSPYPIEQIKVNGKHLHIDDNHKYEGDDHSHEFDHHPIHSIIGTSDDKLSPDARKRFVDSYHDFHAGEQGHQRRWIERHKQMRDSDPEYMNRGLEPGSGLHDFKINSHAPTMHASHSDFGKLQQPAAEQPKQAAPAGDAPKASAQPVMGPNDVDWDAIPADLREKLAQYGIKK